MEPDGDLRLEACKATSRNKCCVEKIFLQWKKWVHRLKDLQPSVMLAAALDPRTKMLVGIPPEEHVRIWDLLAQEITKISEERSRAKVYVIRLFWLLYLRTLKMSKFGSNPAAEPADVHFSRLAVFQAAYSSTFFSILMRPLLITNENKKKLTKIGIFVSSFRFCHSLGHSS